MSFYVVAYCGAMVGLIFGAIVGGWCASLKHNELQQEIRRLQRLVAVTSR